MKKDDCGYGEYKKKASMRSISRDITGALESLGQALGFVFMVVCFCGVVFLFLYYHPEAVKMRLLQETADNSREALRIQRELLAMEKSRLHAN